MPLLSLSLRKIVKTKTATFVVLVFGALILFSYLQPPSHRSSLPSSSPIFTLNNIEGISLVYGAIRSLELPAPVNAAPVHAAIIPHHTLAATPIAEAWTAIAKSTHPSIIVLISPAHDNQGQALVQTTTGTWQTPFGNVKTDNARIANLATLGIPQEPNSFINEHGVGTHIPYIARLFPDVPIIPIIAKSPANQTDATKLIATLQQVLPSDALIVASIDFCHYENAVTTASHDKLTESLITQRAYTRIDTLSSAYLDTPFALEVFLMWSDLHAYPLTQTYHSSSHTLLRNPLLPGTSYFIYMS